MILDGEIGKSKMVCLGQMTGRLQYMGLAASRGTPNVHQVKLVAALIAANKVLQRLDDFLVSGCQEIFKRSTVLQTNIERQLCTHARCFLVFLGRRFGPGFSW